jgi:hypothetical protein
MACWQALEVSLTASTCKGFKSISRPTGNAGLLLTAQATNSAYGCVRLL